MAFTKGINKIYESIKKQPAEKRTVIFEGLKKDIVSSKGLAFKYNLIESVKNYAGKLSEEQADRLIAHLAKTYSTELKEGYSYAAEEKKLFEKYKVSTEPSDITSIDRIVNGKSLNEAAIKKVVINPSKKSVKEAVLTERSLIKENFMTIRRNEDVKSLDEQINYVAKFATFLNEGDRKFINECVNVVKENVYQDFGKAVNRTYQLRLVAKKLFKESQDTMIFEDEATDELNAINKKVETGLNSEFASQEAQIPGEFTYIQNATMEIPKNVNTQLIINFDVPVYPLGYHLANRTVELTDLKAKLTNTKAAFLNKFIYQKGINIFQLHGTIFECNLTTQTEQPAFLKTVQSTGAFGMRAPFEILIGLKQLMTAEELGPIVAGILVDFENYLATAVIPDQINPEHQKEEFAQYAGSEGERNKNYMKHNAQTKYYTDKRGGMLDDTFTGDAVLSGDADESEINSKMDRQFFGDAGQGPDVDASEFDISDEDFDKEIERKLKSGKRAPRGK